MYFEHTPEIWREFPELAAGVIQVGGITSAANVDPAVADLIEIARTRLESTTESQLAEVQAWRRAFSRMGLKPTQYRCASESLLRRFRKEGTLPTLHPLIDLCNATSLAFAIPVAVFDISAIDDHIEVRHAIGDERYLSFAGEIEHPDPGEVIFADASANVHARRWTHRQSGASAVSARTSDVLIVTEAMHDTAAADIRALLESLTGRISAIWQAEPQIAMPSVTAPRFTF